MKRIGKILIMVLIGVFPVSAHAIGIEAAVGAWGQSPSGTMSYDPIGPAGNLDLEDDLNYDDEWQINGRIKVDMPLFLPNIYVMATPMEFDETGSKSVSFKFGDDVYAADIPFDSRLKLNQLDVTLFYGIPFLETATLGFLNIDLGINVKVVDFEAKIQQGPLEQSESATVALPMAYAAAQLKPLDKLALEVEARGLVFNDNSYLSLIGRVKVKPFGPLFVAGGYRYDDVDIDEDDVNVDTEFSGPFAEVGLEF